MRTNVDPATQDYIASRAGVIRRDFLWIEAKNRDTGTLETVGFWNGEDTVDTTVISGSTGLPTIRTYHAAGALLEVDPIPLTTDLTIKTVRVRLSQINEAVALAIRGYDTRLAPVEIHRGFFDLDTRLLVAPPLPRFVGWINGNPINTPSVGEEGGIEVDCVSHTRALTKTNPAKRSDEYQQQRSGDRFRRYTDVAGNWQIFWGEKSASQNAASKAANADLVKKIFSGRGPAGFA